MKRAVLLVTTVAGMLALGLILADVLPSGQALAREAGSPPARLAQSYYLPPGTAPPSPLQRPSSRSGS